MKLFLRTGRDLKKSLKPYPSIRFNLSILFTHRFTHYLFSSFWLQTDRTNITFFIEINKLTVLLFEHVFVIFSLGY